MNFIDKYLLKKISKQPCLDIIPRSGSEGEYVNCYSIRINSVDNLSLLVNKIYDGRFYCKKWDKLEEEFINDELNFSFDEIEKNRIIITHFYGLHTIEFEGLKDFSFNYLTRWIYIKIKVKDTINKIDQYLFNRRKFYTKNKVDLLKFLVESQIKSGTSYGISMTSLMTELYTLKWLYHPNKEEEKRRLSLYLDSMVKSGELEIKDEKYFVSGVALMSLEKYEEEERRHNSSIQLQKGMYFLTAVIAIGTLIQAFS